MTFGKIENHFEIAEDIIKIFTDDLKNHVENAIRENRYISSHEIIKGIFNTEGIEVSDSLIWDVHQEMGYRSIQPIYTPNLTLEQEPVRELWCWYHRDNSFHNVMFLDECNVKLKDKSTVCMVFPDFEEKLHHSYCASVMVRAGISY